jgi:hypothetical protein
MTPPVRGRFDPRLVGAPRTGTLACATSLAIIPDCGGSNGYRDPPSRRAFGLLACGLVRDDAPGQVAALQPGDEPGAGVELPAPQAVSG